MLGLLLAVLTHYDVLIQAGHQGRPDCWREPQSLCHNTGAGTPPGEIVWNPIVANEAARVLRAHGVRVLRLPAYVHGTYHVRVAVYVHFDGNVVPCSSGASVAYPRYSTASKNIADAWKRLYGKYWPYRFKHDDFTPTERAYYAYHHVIATDGQFLIEGGEMTCPAQYAWLKRHLRWEGALLAYFLGERIGVRVPFPAPP
ncbi:MAG TPA: hypothetical protein VMF11_02365 [Candidatus Baltobacteraceae bacterium]|nr:hypothetical protein [Candidatus Baltobacteraceae bacterium]